VAPLVTVSHGSLLVAVQVQPAAVMTGKAMENPALFGTTVGFPTDSLQGTPAWVMVNATPATVMVPVRGLVLVLAATK
jgi:hypothetical protein